MPRELNLRPTRKVDDNPFPPCEVCLRTGTIERDGSPRVLNGSGLPAGELVRRYKPCRCAAGQYMAEVWANLEREFGFCNMEDAPGDDSWRTF